MYTKSWFLTSLLALTATATPINNTLIERDSKNTFNINVWNNCPFVKQVALYQAPQGSSHMLQRSTPTNISPKQMITIAAPFKDPGMRLSGHAEWGADGQWKAQALFEFGYSQYAGMEGTAYDLSIFAGSDPDIGLGAYPIPNGKGSEQCLSKTCFPWDCPLDQGWTNPNQDQIHSPADTVCYHGKTDFKVVFCP
jgi:hypothetical protein